MEIETTNRIKFIWLRPMFISDFNRCSSSADMCLDSLLECSMAFSAKTPRALLSRSLPTTLLGIRVRGAPCKPALSVLAPGASYNDSQHALG